MGLDVVDLFYFYYISFHTTVVVQQGRAEHSDRMVPSFLESCLSKNSNQPPIAVDDTFMNNFFFGTPMLP